MTYTRGRGPDDHRNRRGVLNVAGVTFGMVVVILIVVVLLLFGVNFGH